MKIFYTGLPALVGLLALGLPALGQSPAPDALTAAAVTAAQKQYNDSYVGHPLLFNGPEYIDYSKRYHASIGHQFFQVPERRPGSVYYNDHYFQNLRLTYDVVLDQVVLPQPTSPLTLRLINEQVRYFVIDGHRFIRLVDDSIAGGTIRTGYYEVLVDNRVQVLAKRAKRLQEQINQRAIDAEFVQTDRFFVKKDDVYHPISSKGSVVRLFEDRSKEVQHFLQTHKLSFGKAQFEASVVELALYYCSLPPQ